MSDEAGVGGFGVARVGSARVMARPEDLERVRAMIEAAGSLYDFAARDPHAEAIQGRGTIYVIPAPAPAPAPTPAPGGRWLVRRLGHGGTLAPITGDRFLKLGRARPFNELILSEQLRGLGIPTPAVRAAVVYHAGRWLYRGDIAREEIGDARDLAACLFGPPPLEPPAGAAILAAAGHLVGSLHAVGLVHPDLNLRNVLIEGEAAAPRGHILDLEKCRIVSGLNRVQRERMLARFERSARKLEGRTGRPIDKAAWEAFYEAYRSVG